MLMIYTPLVRKAMKLAYAAHHGQTDRSGAPYIFHPIHVAETVSQAVQEETVVCAALLHDILEDTDLTLEQLEKEFPKEVTEAVFLLTHNPKDDYFDYIQKLKKNPIAVQVKRMDLLHNLDKTRLDGCANVTESQKRAWEKKYQTALAILQETTDEEALGGETDADSGL